MDLISGQSYNRKPIWHSALGLVCLQNPQKRQTIIVHFLGIDVGSSSVKVSLWNADSNQVVASATSPSTEMVISAPQLGFAEQHPDLWWENLKLGIQEIKAKVPLALNDLRAIGISYQMHGLVAIDKNGTPVRPSIIWCDSRAVEIGETAFQKARTERVMSHLLNSPGNFTASKLAWVKENEPDVFKQIAFLMLPGDYITYKLTGEVSTTSTGLSEGILWDYLNEQPAGWLLNSMGIEEGKIPNLAPIFGFDGKVTQSVSQELGIPAGVKVTYRAGDQPNNALALNVLNPGEMAANAGTSGVLYAVNDKPVPDLKQRVNIFLHPNHTAQNPRYGVLACVNGTGILYSWVRKLFATSGQMQSYSELNYLAALIPAGSEGVTVLPYGNGAERTLGNFNPGACFNGIDLVRHSAGHLIRATQEGIAFSLALCMEMMGELNLKIHTVRAGEANLFLSPIFRTTFSTITNTTLQLIETDGAAGAARASAAGLGVAQLEQVCSNLPTKSLIEPDPTYSEPLIEAYGRWKNLLAKHS